MRIALLNAHTSYASGASASIGGIHFNEYALSCKINKCVKVILDENKVDNYIIDTSEVQPYNKSLQYKAIQVNNYKNTTLAIETHFNSVQLFTTMASGMEVLHKSNDQESTDFAIEMVESLKRCLPFKLRRGGSCLYPRDNIYIFNNIEVPTILIEVCFLSNLTDRLFLLHPRAIDIIAYGIYNGILRYGKKRNLLNDG